MSRRELDNLQIDVNCLRKSLKDTKFWLNTVLDELKTFDQNYSQTMDEVKK